jgi:hypothetical protein
MASPFVQKLESFTIERHEALADENGIPKEISVLVLSNR